MNKLTWVTITILALICSWGSLPLFREQPVIAYAMVYSSAVFYGISLAYINIIKSK